MEWPDVPVWKFSQDRSYRFLLKVHPSVEIPHILDRQSDGPLTVSVLENSNHRIVGYGFRFKALGSLRPRLGVFGFSMAANYAVNHPPDDEMLLVLSTPHVRVLRLGSDYPIFQIVMRHKEDRGNHDGSTAQNG